MKRMVVNLKRRYVADCELGPSKNLHFSLQHNLTNDCIIILTIIILTISNMVIILIISKTTFSTNHHLESECLVGEDGVGTVGGARVGHEGEGWEDRLTITIMIMLMMLITIMILVVRGQD